MPENLDCRMDANCYMPYATICVQFLFICFSHAASIVCSLPPVFVFFQNSNDDMDGMTTLDDIDDGIQLPNAVAILVLVIIAFQQTNVIVAIIAILDTLFTTVIIVTDDDFFFFCIVFFFLPENNAIIRFASFFI